MLKRALIALLISAIFFAAWVSLEKISIQVVGQPSTTGYMLDNFEKPFFEQLSHKTGLPIEISYSSSDKIGIKDTYQLTMLKKGALDLVSLRFLQNATTEPMLLGLDLSGATSDLKTARAIVDAYISVLDRSLQENYNSKLLGVWPFGPQVFYCRHPLKGLKDLKGLKIRVGSENFAQLIESFEAKPVVIPFEDVKDSLKNGLVDCAITSAISGNAASWPEYTTHIFPLVMQMGINGYAINLKLWNQFSKMQKERIQTAFENHTKNMWNHVAEIHKDLMSCNIGGDCKHGTPYSLILVEPSDEDIQFIHHAFKNTTFKDWSEKCNSIHPNCANEWIEKISPILQLNNDNAFKLTQ